jgi:hypothetical protein
MIYCAGCNSLHDEQARHCLQCGRHLRDAPRIRGAGDFLHAGDAVSQAIHGKHHRMHLGVAVTLSVVVQVVLLFLLADMRIWWHFLVMGAMAACVTVALHRFRRGHLSCILAMNVGTLVVGGMIGFLDLQHGIHLMLALWLLSYWYAFLGHHLRMGHEHHA